LKPIFFWLGGRWVIEYGFYVNENKIYALFRFCFRSAFQYIENFAGTVPKLGTGVMLIKLMLTLAEKSDSNDACVKTGEVNPSIFKDTIAEFLTHYFYSMWPES
jgi:hypothetical protein